MELPLEARPGEGGYAAEQGAEFLARQRQLISDTVARSDVVITTAAVPGRPAPRLVTTAMVERMRRGSVIVDLAAASGGNCELTVDGEEIDYSGVLVIGAGDLPSSVPATASSLYARNVSTFLGLLVREGGVQPDFDDDIVDATCVTAGGADPPPPDPGAAGRGRTVTGGPLDILVIFVLAAFVGFEVISKVPSILHTPLMSGSNAIHGDHPGRRHDRRQRGPRRPADHPGPAGRDPGHPQHRRGGGGDRPHAGDVQRAATAPASRRPLRPAATAGSAGRRRGPASIDRFDHPQQRPGRRLPDRVDVLHRRPQGPELAEAGPAGAT